MADQVMAGVDAMLERLGGRFDLLVEAVSGLRARLEQLKNEIFGQFAEVGSQIRFLSDQIAENRSGIASLKTDFAAEMIRLGEQIGRTRVELREQVEAPKRPARTDTATQAAPIAATPNRRKRDAGDAADGEVSEALRILKRELTATTELTNKKLGAQIKQTNKILAALSRKFERFDDRVTVQVRDQEQRLKKLAGRAKP